MIILRIVELEGNHYGVQIKNNFLSQWEWYSRTGSFHWKKPGDVWAYCITTSLESAEKMLENVIVSIKQTRPKPLKIIRVIKQVKM